MPVKRRIGEQRLRLRPDRLLAGQAEPIFDALPESILGNLRHPGSENALLWNSIYPLAQPTLSLSQFLALPCQWGSYWEVPPEDELIPYYWGYSLAGERLPELESFADASEGPESRIEVDLFLLGKRHLVLVEAKHLSGLGRCSRYTQGRCPEIQPPGHGEGSCRYWDHPEFIFSSHLRFGERPTERSEAPPCSRHYQIARTLLLGARLAAIYRRTLHLWLIMPMSRWRSIEPDWLDFCDRVRDSELWKRLRVLTWEALAAMER